MIMLQEGKAKFKEFFLLFFNQNINFPLNWSFVKILRKRYPVSKAILITKAVNLMKILHVFPNFILENMAE